MAEKKSVERKHFTQCLKGVLEESVSSYVENSDYEYIYRPLFIRDRADIGKVISRSNFVSGVTS